MVHTHTRKMGELVPAVLPQGDKTCFVSSVINSTQPFGYLSCTNFDHFWNNRRESICECVHWWIIFQFLRREFSRSQNRPKYGTLGWGVCDGAAAQTAQLWAMGIISGVSGHFKNVPFVGEFWWETYDLSAISSRKSWNFPESVPELT